MGDRPDLLRQIPVGGTAWAGAVRTVHTMLLTSIASHPATSPTSLQALATHATSTCAGRRYVDSRTISLIEALCLNLRTPQHVVDDLVANTTHGLEFALRREGTDAADAVRLLALTAGKTPQLRTALGSVMDPDGILARYALDTAPGARVWQVLLRDRRAPRDVRLEAATAMASRDRHTQQDVKDVVMIAATYPGAAEHLRQVATNPDLLAALAGVDADWTERGTALWFSDSTLPVEKALSWLESHGEARAWRTALDNYTRLGDGRLGQAALAALGDDETILRRLTDAAQPAPVREAALLALARGGHQVSRGSATLRALLTRVPLDVLVSYLPVLKASDVLDVMVRDDLDTATLDALTAMTVNGNVTERDLALYGMALATHPCSSADQRRQGATFAHVAGPGRTPFDKVAIAQAAHVADLGLTLDRVGPGAVGKALPAPVLTSYSLTAVPTIGPLVAAALDEAAQHLSAQEVTTVLAWLSESFTGTLGDLIDSAAAITT